MIILSTEPTAQEPRISKPPLELKEFLKYLGPAFIFTAAQIGGGELVTVPLLGAYFGMVGLFLVPLIAFIKVFGQYYLVQYGVVRGKTFLSTCWEKPWLRWLFSLSSIISPPLGLRVPAPPIPSSLSPEEIHDLINEGKPRQIAESLIDLGGKTGKLADILSIMLRRRDQYRYHSAAEVRKDLANAFINP